MNVAIIGSTQYKEAMLLHQKNLNQYGQTFDARIATFDTLDVTGKEAEFTIATLNLDLLRWAEEVHVFWDQRSLGTIFDLGMCFALGKRIRIEYMEERTFKNLMNQMEADKCQDSLRTAGFKAT